MNPKHLEKIKRGLLEVRRSPYGRKAADLEALAEALGRHRDRRGKEPAWTRSDEPRLSPRLTIPRHAGDLKVGTVQSIVRGLLNDVTEWENYLLGNDRDR